MDEKNLVKRTLAGDRQAFGDLVECYERLVHGVILEAIRRPDDVEDLVQDVFCKAYERLHTLQNPSRFGGWIRKIANNEAIDWQRRQQVRQHVEYDDERMVSLAERQPDQIAEANEGSDRLWQALDSLVPDYRRIVILRYIEGCTYKEISRFLGVAQPTVVWRLRQARWKLGEALGTVLGQEAVDQREARRRISAKIMACLPVVTFFAPKPRKSWNGWGRWSAWIAGGVGLVGMAGLAYQRVPTVEPETHTAGFHVRRAEVTLPKTSVSWEPKRPQAGDPVRVEIAGIVPEGDETIELHYITSTGWLKNKTVEMKREQGAWVATIHVPERVPRIFFYTSSGKGSPVDFRAGLSGLEWRKQFERYQWSFPVHDEALRPLPGAWSMLARLQLIAGQPYEQILANLDREIALYPDRPTTYLSRLSTLLKRGGPYPPAQAHIRKEVKALRGRFADDPQFLWSLAIQIGDLDPDFFYRNIRERFPDFAELDQVAFWVCKEYEERGDREKQVLALEAFKQAYPRHQYTDDAERMLLKTLLDIDVDRAALRADSLIAGSLVIDRQAIRGKHRYEEEVDGGSLPQGLAYSLRFELFLRAGKTKEALTLAADLVESGLEDPLSYLHIGEKLAGQESGYLLETEPTCPVDRVLAARVLAAGLTLAESERVFALAGYNTDFGQPDDANEVVRDYNLVKVRKLRFRALRALGQCYADDGTWAQSLPLLQEAIVLQREVWQEGRLDEKLFLAAIRAHQAVGEDPVAEALCLEILQHVHSHPQVEEILLGLYGGDKERWAQRLRSARPLAPDISLKGLGEYPMHWADYRGRAVLLYYSNLLSDRLEERLAELAIWRRRWDKRAVEILVIVDGGAESGWYQYRGAWVQSRREVQRLVRKWGADFLFAVDDGSVQRTYKPNGRGEFFLIDPQGRFRLRQDQHSAARDEYIKHMVTQLLEERVWSSQN